MRTLAFHNTHTNEKLEAPYRVAGHYQESGLTAIDWILRDHRTGDVVRIDPKLLDLLHLLREQAAGAASPAVYEIASGFRSPRSNELLRNRSGAVARHSLHLKGMAADVRLTGVPLRRLQGKPRSTSSVAAWVTISAACSSTSTRAASAPGKV